VIRRPRSRLYAAETSACSQLGATRPKTLPRCSTPSFTVKWWGRQSAYHLQPRCRADISMASPMAITPEEQATRGEVNSLSEERRVLDQEIGHRRWEIERTQNTARDDLDLEGQSLPEMPLLIDVTRRSVSARLASASKVPTGGDAELAATREQRIANVTKNP